MEIRQQEIVQATEEYVRSLCEHESSGHDWWHIVRVRQSTRVLAQKEGASLFICEMAALLHDVADRKFNPSLEAGLEKVDKWLEKQAVVAEDREHILQILEVLSFTSQQEGKEVTSLEGKIVQDADRLDALGAIGIARAMAYSGHTGRLIYQPIDSQNTAIAHFYDKLLLLKELMNTDYGRELAEERHRFMESYLERFYKEWQGEC